MKLRKTARKLVRRLQAIRDELSSQWGKRALQRRAHEDAADVKARLADIVRRWPEQVGTSNARPIFIFAAGWRSGSTLVQRMLTSVDDIMIWGEAYSRSQLAGTLLNQFCAITMDYPPEHYVAHAFEGELDDQWIANIYPSFDHLIRAHRAFFTELFAVPAQAMGRPRWGFKEVRLTSEHALYLKLLYPAAKFVFVYRNPVEAYLSFHNHIKADYAPWPDRPIVSARDFGALWCEMVADFSDNHKAVDGMLIRYEELLRDPSVHRQLCDYVEVDIRPVATFDILAGRARRIRLGKRARGSVPGRDVAILKRQVAPLLARLGHTYRGF
jgi:Sulfotransferase family